MTTLTKVDPMSWAKVYAVMAMLMVTIIGTLQLIFLSLLTPFLTSLGEGQIQGLGASVAGFGVLGLIVFIPVSGGIAFVVGWIGALLLNLVLKWTGGLKLELDKA